MRGIAHGANAAGAKWLDRKLDLATPTGIEGAGFTAPAYAGVMKVSDHCSAFATTGPATRDGRTVIGHVTWGRQPWPSRPM